MQLRFHPAFRTIIESRRRKPAILSKLARSRMAEGVGFEPTVGFPTLDFESSALNRTQPPFLGSKRTSNVERPTSNVERKCHCEVGRWVGAGYSPKNVTIFSFPCLFLVLHIVYPT